MSAGVVDREIRIRALDLVIRANQTVRGWEIKTAGELLTEAEIVAAWIKTGKRPAPQKKAKK